MERLVFAFTILGHFDLKCQTCQTTWLTLGNQRESLSFKYILQLFKLSAFFLNFKKRCKDVFAVEQIDVLFQLKNHSGRFGQVALCKCSNERTEKRYHGATITLFCCIYVTQKAKVINEGSLKQTEGLYWDMGGAGVNRGRGRGWVIYRGWVFLIIIDWWNGNGCWERMWGLSIRQGRGHDRSARGEAIATVCVCSRMGVIGCGCGHSPPI